MIIPTIYTAFSSGLFKDNKITLTMVMFVQSDSNAKYSFIKIDIVKKKYKN